MGYRTLGELGRGAFGKVYLIEDDYGCRFAAKTLEPQPHILQNVGYEHLLARFSREVRYQSAIEHPNVVGIKHYDLTTNPPFCIMPLAECSLAQELAADRTLGGNPTAALFDILAGLEALQEKGYVHRDLKPQNVLKFGSTDGDVHYAISDFGLMTAGHMNSTTLTGTHAQGGTVNYAAPELIGNFRRATVAADIYSFGAILHDIFSGEPRIPYTELSVPGSLGPIVEKCTKRNPVRRYTSIAALRQDLFEALKNDVVHFVSARDEQAVALLRAKDILSDEEWDLVYLLLDEGGDDQDRNRAIYRALRDVHVDQLGASAPELLKAIGMAFADYVRRGVFDFDYCDVLAAKLQKFYDFGDVELKAAALIALMEMGVRHNRWAVENRFMRLAGPDAQDNVVDRFAVEVAVQNIDLERLISHIENSINTSRQRLHPMLLGVLEQCA